MLFVAVPVRADDVLTPRSVLDKGIEAMGGKAYLGKFKASSSKMKGEIFIQGAKLPFAGDVQTQGADQQRVAIELTIDGQKISVVQVLNRDRGWVKLNDATMDKDKLAETLEQTHAGWVATLVPLTDEAFKLDTVGEVQVEGQPAIGIRVSHAGRRDVNLFFDKKTRLLVKTETRVKDEETKQEMTEESFLSGYDGKDIQQAFKITVKRDGKLFLEAELSDIKLEEKLDDSVFAKP
jgi:hypothetical protein